MYETIYSLARVYNTHLYVYWLCDILYDHTKKQIASRARAHCNDICIYIYKYFIECERSRQGSNRSIVKRVWVCERTLSLFLSLSLRDMSSLYRDRLAVRQVGVARESERQREGERAFERQACAACETKCQNYPAKCTDVRFCHE